MHRPTPFLIAPRSSDWAIPEQDTDIPEITMRPRILEDDRFLLGRYEKKGSQAAARFAPNTPQKEQLFWALPSALDVYRGRNPTGYLRRHHHILII